ncbi:hypothetical protein Athai_41240 [Actinocatenispora thailandica]|uniref:CBM6 domain-containing protein n=1 Tax=Actinocatenispora thailandica TaxID=227318 RepID=A0A7R7HYG6_9ACTN|nr:carbohydrate-binding protein [Actinocatenispora thailandica]BCJ36621.1 hypothetical protein Athai_41240 [Actinocatenispora thailandica]
MPFPERDRRRRRLRLFGAGTAGVLLAAALVAAGTAPATAAPACSVGTVCQAETAQLSGGAHANTNHSGYTGSGFVDGYGTQAHPVVGADTRWSVTGTAAGDHVATVRYANADPGDGSSAARTIGIYADDTRLGTLTLPPTGSWDSWATAQATVSLPANTGTVALRCGATDSCMVNLDYLALSAPGAPVPTPPEQCTARGGSYTDAGLIGWEGDKDGVVVCQNGSFYLRDGRNVAEGFGVAAAPSRLTWSNVDGYLPALATAFDTAGGARVTVTDFADKLTIGGHDYVAVYSRVAVHNPTRATLTVDPAPTDDLLALDHHTNTVPPGHTVTHDYVVAADRFGADVAWPSAAQLTGAGGYARHFGHMKRYWDSRLDSLAQLDALPDRSLVDAYKSGYVYTLIAKDGVRLNTGENGYDEEYSHDTIGILATQFSLGDTTDATALLLRLRDLIGGQPQYVDGVWKYSWPWAVYLAKTGDLDTVRAHFDTEGPAGASQPSIADTAHQIAADRTGPGGIMKMTNDIDSNGYWTIDDYSALMGLASYRYLAQRLGERAEVDWADRQYDALLAATNATLAKTMADNDLDYLPCSMLEPNTANRCKVAADANWAAPFLFGRWAWDGYLFGARQDGPALTAIDPTYAYGFDRIGDSLPAHDFGGYPGNLYASAYNAGYGAAGLRGSAYRDEPIRAYQMMIEYTQSGPYSWWESASAPNPDQPWVGSHPAHGNGSAPHAWGISTANKALLESLVAQRVNGDLLVGRGVPDSWLGKPIRVSNVPTLDGGRVAVTITGRGRHVTLTVTGAGTSRVLFQLPAFAGNVAATTAGHADSAGTVTLPAGTRHVTVTLRHSVS